MALADLVEQLDALVASAVDSFSAATSSDDLEAARVEYLGAKKGKLKAAQKLMGSVDKDDRPAAGKRFNEVKQQIE